MRFTRSSRFLSLMVFAFVLFASACLFAGVAASMSGTVTDASGGLDTMVSALRAEALPATARDDRFRTRIGEHL